MIMTVSCILGGYVSCSIFCSFSKCAQNQHLAPITNWGEILNGSISEILSRVKCTFGVRGLVYVTEESSEMAAAQYLSTLHSVSTWNHRSSEESQATHWLQVSMYQHHSFVCSPVVDADLVSTQRKYRCSDSQW